MSDAAANKALLADVYRRWHETRGGCLEEVIGIFADEIRFGSLAQGAAPVAFTALAIGKEQMRGYFAGLLSGWSMIHYTVDHMIAEGEHVAVIGSTAWTNKATGKVADTPKVDVWRLQNGRAVEFYEYYDTAKLFAAATPG
jgi:ketosteroid isomerase-like protein